ncbi:MAG: sulfite exporter TauE/SafE family protein, partial [Gammaproteobacteria bacterium]|nr:sulfite exporter TauE/SafE family protein [Gammaproteobacteria bacterium]
LVLGAIAGAGVADHLASTSLRIFFGIFELAVAVQMAWGGSPSTHRELPGKPLQICIGVLIGAVSALVGIGGGTMTVPFLIWCNINARQAVATSAAAGLPIAMAGASGFVLAGLDGSLPDWSIGYIYLPAFAGIVLTTVLFAPLGARLAHTLPATVLRRIFALFLLVVGMKMLWV